MRFAVDARCRGVVGASDTVPAAFIGINENPRAVRSCSLLETMGKPTIDHGRHRAHAHRSRAVEMRTPTEQLRFLIVCAALLHGRAALDLQPPPSLLVVHRQLRERPLDNAYGDEAF